MLFHVLGGVAVTSACDGREAVLQCLRMGAADFLIHPLRINELLVLGTRICHSKQVNHALAAIPLLLILLHLSQRTSLMCLIGSSCVAILGWCFVTNTSVRISELRTATQLHATGQRREDRASS